MSLFIARKSLHTDPRISNRGSLLGKRGSVRVGSALLSRKADSPLPFPDSGMLLMWIGCSVVYGGPNPQPLTAELQPYSMSAFNWLLTLFFLVGCKESTQPKNTSQKPPETQSPPSSSPLRLLFEPSPSTSLSSSLRSTMESASLPD